MMIEFSPKKYTAEFEPVPKKATTYRLDSRKGPKSSQHCTEKSLELFYDL